MWFPSSPIKIETLAATEIALFELAESANEARTREYVSDDGWYVEWLGRALLGDAMAAPDSIDRLANYQQQSSSERRRTFAGVLERGLPEAMRAPLIVYRLLAPAVAIVTGMAFGDQARVYEARKQQLSLLPGIADCSECHGRLLEIGEACRQCGNPFWKFQWLVAD
jgi:hypothetical protein